MTTNLSEIRFYNIFCNGESCFTIWNALLVVHLQGCTIACSLKQAFHQCKLF